MARQGTWSLGVHSVGEGDEELAIAVLVDEDSGEVIAHDSMEGILASESLVSMLGRAISELGRPRKLIAQDGSIAKLVRGGRFQFEIVVGHAPGLAAAIEALDAAIASEELGWLGGEGVDAPCVREFAEAAAAMLEIEPWEQWDEDQIFSVAIPARGMEEAGLFVLGAGDEEDEDLTESGERQEPGPGGWMMIFAPEDLEAMFAASATGGAPKADSLSLHFLPVAGLSERLAEEARDLGIAGEGVRWIASLSRTTRDGGAIAPSARDYHVATALCAALVEAASEDAAEAIEAHGFVAMELELPGGDVLHFEGPGDDEDEDAEGEDAPSEG